MIHVNQTYTVLSTVLYAIRVNQTDVIFFVAGKLAEVYFICMVPYACNALLLNTREAV